MVDVDKLVQASIDSGAKVALGGGPHELGGCFYQPTVLTEVTSQMAVFRNEIFGPVAPVVRFSTEAEVIAMANDTEFGLASYFYTRDIGRVWRVPRPWSTVSSASTRASSPTKWHPLVAS